MFFKRQTNCFYPLPLCLSRGGLGRGCALIPSPYKDGGWIPLLLYSSLIHPRRKRTVLSSPLMSSEGQKKLFHPLPLCLSRGGLGRGHDFN